MKKLTVFITMMFLVFMLVACDQTTTEGDDNENDTPPNGEVDNGEDSNDADDSDDDNGEDDATDDSNGETDDSDDSNDDTDDSDDNDEADDEETFWYSETYDGEIERLMNILKTLEENHYSGLSTEAYFQGAIRGLFDALDDPYSTYMEGEEYEQFQQSLGEDFVGLGVTVENYNDNVVIQKVWSDSPAEREGVLVGDTITHIDGLDVRNKSYLETMMHLMGEEDTSVEIGVERPTHPDTIFMTVARERIANPSIEKFTFEDDDKLIGKIKINTFGDETADLFDEALDDLEEQDIDALIIDLRNNGGGRLDTVIHLLDIFLVQSTTPMFSLEYFQDGEVAQSQSVNASGTERKPYDVITIINEYSASASEVFAAGMKQNGGYDVLGMPSLGKGTMQNAFVPSDDHDDVLHISLGRWLTPDGTWINAGDGDQEHVYPTIEVSSRHQIHEVTNLYLGEGETYGYDDVNTNNVLSMQVILNALNYGNMRSDGYFDQNTEDALKDYQEAYDLDITGELDGQTAQQLNESLIELRNDIDFDSKTQLAISILTGQYD